MSTDMELRTEAVPELPEDSPAEVETAAENTETAAENTETAAENTETAADECPAVAEDAPCLSEESENVQSYAEEPEAISAAGYDIIGNIYISDCPTGDDYAPPVTTDEPTDTAEKHDESTDTAEKHGESAERKRFGLKNIFIMLLVSALICAALYALGIFNPKPTFFHPSGSGISDSDTTIPESSNHPDEGEIIHAILTSMVFRDENGFMIYAADSQLIYDANHATNIISISVGRNRPPFYPVVTLSADGHPEAVPQIYIEGELLEDGELIDVNEYRSPTITMEVKYAHNTWTFILVLGAENASPSDVQ